MRRITAFIVVILFFANTAKTQYVNIPDSNFRAFLILKYPVCFNSAKMMDTTCTEIGNETTFYIVSTNAISLEGVEYFSNLKMLFINDNPLLTSLPKLPQSLENLYCRNSPISKLPQLPVNLKILGCLNSLLDSLSQLPNNLVELDISGNNFSSLNNLPLNLKRLSCSNNKLSVLPILNDSLEGLDIQGNQFSVFPSLPKYLKRLNCSFNNFSLIDKLPETLRTLIAYSSNPICIGKLPRKLNMFYASYYTFLKCVPNIPDSCVYANSYSGYIRKCPVGICNPTNNPSHCQAYPTINSFVYLDVNNNNKFDSSEFVKSKTKVSLSNNKYSYTNKNGIAEIVADSLGNYTITATPPNFYNATPSSYTHNFYSYDTIVFDTFALKPNRLVDSLTIKATPINWAARPGFIYPYFIQYENIGTTILSPNINFNYNNSLLTYDSSSNNLVTNTGNNLGLSVGNLVQGETESFVAYFKVKTTAALGTNLLSIASINGGTSNAFDSVKSIVRGSYDPNDKQATKALTIQDVADGFYINYTIRFQNTGTDTAFNVIIADTLSNLLDANNLQMVSSSHPCKTTIKNNIVYFEFYDINLPDSNTNKYRSNGFVNFKVKPVSNVIAGNVIANKAYIYFDYNKSILTNIATTTITNPLPLKLIAFSAIQQQNKSIFVYWNTANEINTSHFVLEESSNGRNFINAAEIAANGSGNNSYFYLLEQKNIIFLRLRIVDNDGRIEYSNIVKISQSTNESITISPNPAKNYLNIKINTARLDNTKATLTNIQGLVIKSFILHQGLQSIDIVDLSNGLYYLQTEQETIKMVLKK